MRHLAEVDFFLAQSVDSFSAAIEFFPDSHAFMETVCGKTTCSSATPDF